MVARALAEGHLKCSGLLQRSIVGTGDPAWAARYGGGGPRSRYTQPPPSPGASVGRVGPRTYMAPSISNQHYGMVTLSFKFSVTLWQLAAAGRLKMQGLLSSLQPAWTMARPENQMQHSSAIQLEQLCCLRACLLRCLETWHAVTGAVGDAQSADGEHVCRALAIQQLSGAAPCPDSRRAHEEPQRLPGTYPL